jgi:hypothetical protein
LGCRWRVELHADIHWWVNTNPPRIETST